MKTYIKYLMLSVFMICGTIVSAQNLEDYLKFAAENNPEVKAAYSRFEAALQKAPQVSSLPDPTLTVSAFGRMIETRLGAQEARFSLTQMFPWFGKLAAEKNTANLMAEAKFQQFLAKRERLFLKVREAYAELYSVKEVIRLNEDNLEILDSYRKLALNKFEAGSAPMVNVVKVDIKREEASTEIELMKAELETLKRQFNLLLNRPQEMQVNIGEILTDVSVQPSMANQSNFSGHPEIEMLENEMAAYENEVVVAEKAGLPSLGLGVDYSIISKRTDADPMDNGQDAIMPMFSVSLPIFRKKYKAAKEEAEFMAEATMHEKDAVINQFKSEIEMARYNLNKSERLIALYERQIEASGQANKLLISGFSNAKSDFEEVLQMNQDILLFEKEKIGAEANAFKAKSKLQFLLYKNNTDENK